MICRLSPLEEPLVGPRPLRYSNAGRLRLTVAGLVVVAIAAGGLAGCGSISDAANTVGLPVQDWSDVRSAREPKPALVELRHEVGFIGTSYVLDRAEADRLRVFLAGVDLGKGDQVLVVSGPPDDAAPGNAAWLAGRRADAIAAFLTRERVDAKVARAAANPSRPNAQVTVLVRRYVAVLPACPDWSDVPGISFNNQPTSNWSCATAMNFGMMLADPGDLVRGRDPGYADGEYSARGVERYRLGKSKDLIRDASASETFPDAGGAGSGGD